MTKNIKGGGVFYDTESYNNVRFKGYIMKACINSSKNN